MTRPLWRCAGRSVGELSTGTALLQSSHRALPVRLHGEARQSPELLRASANPASVSRVRPLRKWRIPRCIPRFETRAGQDRKFLSSGWVSAKLVTKPAQVPPTAGRADARLRVPAPGGPSLVEGLLPVPRIVKDDTWSANFFRMANCQIADEPEQPERVPVECWFDVGVVCSVRLEPKTTIKSRGSRFPWLPYIYRNGR